MFFLRSAERHIQLGLWNPFPISGLQAVRKRRSSVLKFSHQPAPRTLQSTPYKVLQVTYRVPTCTVLICVGDVAPAERTATSCHDALLVRRTPYMVRTYTACPCCRAIFAVRLRLFHSARDLPGSAGSFAGSFAGPAANPIPPSPGLPGVQLSLVRMTSVWVHT